MHSFKLFAVAACATSLLLLPGSALAAPRDADRDRLPDRWELAHHLKAGKRDAARDLDRDGLSNLGEYLSRTDPRSPDSDDDGVRDAQEDADRDRVDNGNEMAQGSSPRKRDSDRDGRSDADEDADRDGLDNEAEDATGNDPRDPDSDADGVEDGAEQAAVVTGRFAGVLRLKLPGGRSTSGRVMAETEVLCASGEEEPRGGSRAGFLRAAGIAGPRPEQDEGEDLSGGEEIDEDDAAAPEAAELEEAGDDTGARRPQRTGQDAQDAGSGEGDGGCTVADLARGAAVLDAAGHVRGAGFVFDRIVIAG